MRTFTIAVAFAALLVLVTAVGTLAQADEGTPAVVMLSTDYGLGVIGGATNGPDRHAADVDDAYAIALALGAADVRAVISTFGNDKAGPSAESARRGLAALGVDEPAAVVVAGSEGFLDAEPVSFVPDDPSAATPVFCVNDGVERMRSLLEEQAPETVTLFAIGPFTDIACLRRAYPDAFGRLKEIIGLVGSSDGQPVLGGIDVVDFNFAMDPTALGEVITAVPGVPITFLMFDVTQLGTLSNEVIGEWVANGTDAQRFYGQATQPHAEYWDAIFSDTDGQALFDAHTVYYFLQPDAYACEDGMVATAIVGGYPDTSASTTRNSLTVVSAAGDPPPLDVVQDGSTFTYTGLVRGCDAFAEADGLNAFEQAVVDSIIVVD